MVSYKSYSNATLATVLSDLATDKVGPGRIVSFFWNGSAYVAIVVIE